MKKSIKWIIALVVCVAVFIGVYFLYNALKEEYEPERFATQTKTSQQSDNSDKQTENKTAQTESNYSTASDFTVLDEKGNKVKLSDYFGKPIVLNFWASWCYYCKEEMPDFNEAYKKHSDIQFLMVNATDGASETIGSAKNYVDSQGFDFPIYFDTYFEASNAYQVTGLPMTVFIDKNGKLITYTSGMLTASELEKGISLIK